MVEEIQRLLLTHNCVIVPGLGAFIGNYKPANIQLQEHKIYPPSKNIAFNKVLQTNDGLLINAIAHTKNLSFQEAETSINEFVRQCKSSLQQNRSFLFKDIGKLVLDDENNVQFIPFHSKNYNADSFGLPEMQIIPIKRLAESEQEIKATYQHKLHPEKLNSEKILGKRNRSVFYWLAASVMLVAILCSTWIINKNKIKPNQSESSMLAVFDTPTTELPMATQATNQTIATPEMPVEIPTTQKPLKTSEENIAKSYVVIGTFFDQNLSLELKAEVEKAGYVVKIYKDEQNGLFRTTIQVEEANVDSVLGKIKSDINKRAWIYCVSCNLN